MSRILPIIFTLLLAFSILFIPKQVLADMSVGSEQQVSQASSNPIIIAQNDNETLLSDEVNNAESDPPGEVMGSWGELPPKGFATNLLGYINSILTIVMVLALALVLFNFIMAGINWITAGGDKGKTDEARTRMINAVVGILIVSASFAVLRFVGYFLGFEDFADVISSIIPIG